MEMKWKTSLHAAWDLVLPRRCVVCGRKLLLEERDICTCCLADLPLCRYASQERNPMAGRFNAAIERLRTDDSPFEAYSRAAALFFYQDGYQEITPSLKYGRNFAAGRHFAHMLGHQLAQSPLYLDVDCVVPVPLHWSRRWRRGYNQAEIIAAEVAVALGAKMDSGLLKRCRRTETQTRLDREGKALNVAGAFKAASRREKISHILLVDDVFTTGSTLAECHSALRRVFPSPVRISAVTLALVEPASSVW